MDSFTWNRQPACAQFVVSCFPGAECKGYFGHALVKCEGAEIVTEVRFSLLVVAQAAATSAAAPSSEEPSAADEEEDEKEERGYQDVFESATQIYCHQSARPSDPEPASSSLLPQDGKVKKKRHYRPGFSDRAFKLISDRLVYFLREGDSRPRGTFFITRNAQCAPEAEADLFVEFFSEGGKNCSKELFRFEDTSLRDRFKEGLQAAIDAQKPEYLNRVAADQSMLDKLNALRMDVARANDTSEALHKELAEKATLQEVRLLLDNEIERIKVFMAAVCKSVPRPVRIEAKREWWLRKVVKLVFQCPVTNRELEVESRSWSLWLKFAFAFVKTGTSILESDFAGAAESGAAALESLYNAYHEKESDQKSFDLLLRAPLLLSSEQDELLGGLRREGFFEKFTYDPLRGQWVAFGEWARTGLVACEASGGTRD